MYISRSRLREIVLHDWSQSCSFAALLLCGAGLLFVQLSTIASVFFINIGALSLVHAVMPMQDFVGSEVVRNGDLSEAMGNLSFAARLDSRNPGVNRWMSLVAFAQGDIRASIMWGQRATQMQPSDRMAALLLGYALSHTQYLDQSMAAWRQAGAAPYFIQQASSLQRAGKTEDAIASYRIALSLEPQVDIPTQAGIDIAWAHYSHGDNRAAELILLEIVRAAETGKEPDWLHSLAQGELGMYYLREGQWGLAATHLRGAVDIVQGKGVFEYQLWLGKAYMKLGLFELSEVELYKALNAPNPNVEASAYVVLAETFIQESAWDKAMQAYQQAIRLFPDNRDYREGLIGVYLKVGQPSKALGEMEILLKLFPADGGLRAQYDQLKSELGR